MGWWHCGEGGGFNADDMIKAFSEGSLLNRERGDPTENYYNGDGPADEIGDQIYNILNTLSGKGYGEVRWHDEKELPCTVEELYNILFKREIPERYKEYTEELNKIVTECWQEIDSLYLLS
jgi:hypothetical protein